MKKEKDNNAGLWFVLFFVFLFFIGLVFFIIDTNNAQDECVELGYDYLKPNPDYICVKKIGLDKYTGEYKECYMQLSKGLTAEEYCGVYTKAERGA